MRHVLDAAGVAPDLREKYARPGLLVRVRDAWRLLSELSPESREFRVWRAEMLRAGFSTNPAGRTGVSASMVKLLGESKLNRHKKIRLSTLRTILEESGVQTDWDGTSEITPKIARDVLSRLEQGSGARRVLEDEMRRCGFSMTGCRTRMLTVDSPEIVELLNGKNAASKKGQMRPPVLRLVSDLSGIPLEGLFRGKYMSKEAANTLLSWLEPDSAARRIMKAEMRLYGVREKSP